MLVRPAGEERTHALSFGMVAPGGLDPADYPLTGEAGADMFGWPAVLEDRNMRGPLAVAVPGAGCGPRPGARAFRHLELVRPRGARVRTRRAGHGGRLARHPRDCGVRRRSSRMTPAAPPRISRTDCRWRRPGPGDAPRIGWPARGDPAPARRSRASGLLHRRDRGSDLRRHGCARRASFAEDLAAYEAQVEEAPATRYRDALVMTAPGLTAGPTLVDVLGRLAASLEPGESPGGEAYVA